jgi:hypothetical protein
MTDQFDPYHRWLGISPEHRPPNHYQLLGIPLFESDADVIETAANRQMAHVRSYQHGKHVPWSQQLLNELSTAKLCLLDATKKAQYDAQLKVSRPAASVPPPVVPTQRPPPPAEPAPQIAVKVRATGKEPAAGRRPTRDRKRLWLAAILFVLGLLAAVAVAGIVVVVVPRRGTLVVALPPGNRTDLVLIIDGHDQSLPAAGNLQLKLPAGPHTVQARREAYNPFQQSVDVTAGGEHLIEIRMTPQAQLTVELVSKNRKDVTLTLDGRPLTVPASGKATVACRPGQHTVRVAGPYESFEKAVDIAPGQHLTLPIALLSDSPLVGQWRGGIEIDEAAFRRKLDEANANPLQRAFAQSIFRGLQRGTIDLQFHEDGSFDAVIKLGPLSSSDHGTWSIASQQGARTTIETIGKNGRQEYRRVSFEDNDTFTTELPGEAQGLGVFRCRRVQP